MRIIMPTFERLEWMPPTIDLIKKLNAKGNEIVCITIFPSNYLKSLELENVSNISLWPSEISMQGLISYKKGMSGVLFRIDECIKKILGRRLKKVIDEELKKGGKLWVVNEMTTMVAGTSFLKNKKYLFTVYELHERKVLNDTIRKAAQNAELVIVPEYCRAHIMQSRYELKETPMVIPNKSDIAIDTIELSDKALCAIQAAECEREKGIRLVLYMGGIGRERPLESFLNAIEANKNYKLAIIGRKTPYLCELQEKYGEKIVYLGAFLPPEHLAVARHTDIGLLNYVIISQKQGLNALFCAPNKIYEYTGLGLPVLGNDIPGLRFDIQRSCCGYIVDYQKEDTVISALDSIVADYEYFSNNAKAFYKNTDIDGLLLVALQRLEQC